ncbi:Uncharacterized Fe-S protein [Candidatus Koribacter versatilis Ellin345]|uniref:Uncharacterized Fe-S protein n=1 Tax=Koribacter versatilis (strain Ellin345) TaxID=204669 RepID=Q1ISN7_KORVE|nr:MOSC N-terminal beta barrel domain-containing protein [Candidatus Koribacter versatilis]ABF40113.1 Uncharacterized Fe-S protein [Candidatus Koribacter versatilis Ellin345]
MLVEIGQVEALFRYPVKSMAGERLESAELGWHGFEGDRRFALRRVNDRGAFPWLTAGKLPELVRYLPMREGDGVVPTHVRMPDGTQLPIFSEELAAEIEGRYGAPVQMVQMKHGIFDDASISVIASETTNEVARLAGQTPDVRRFRPNIVVRLQQPSAFQEDEWLGGVLEFGEEENAPAIAVTMRDLRCAMINLDPDTAKPETAWMKAAVRANGNNAGVYGTVTRMGRISVGQGIIFRPARPV